MAFKQDKYSDAVACRHRFGRLVGRWSDQFSSTYALTRGSGQTMDVETHRESGQTRCTEGLIRIHETAEGCQIVWGRVGKPPVYILTSCSDEYAIWKKVGASNTFHWTRQADASEKKESADNPVAVELSCALSDKGGCDAFSDADSEYGVSDRQLAAVAMLPETRWEWPLTKAETNKRIQMIWEQDRLLQNQDLLAELVLQNQEIEELRNIIRDQAQELEILRGKVASGTSEGKGGPETMEEEACQAVDPQKGESCGSADKEDALVDGSMQGKGEALQHTEDIGVICNEPAKEAVQCNKRKQAKKERRKRQAKAKQVPGEWPPASSHEPQEEATGSVEGPGSDGRNKSHDEAPRGGWKPAAAGVPTCAPARGADWRPNLWGNQGSQKRPAWKPKR